VSHAQLILRNKYLPFRKGQNHVSLSNCQDVFNPRNSKMFNALSTSIHSLSRILAEAGVPSFIESSVLFHRLFDGFQQF
jgi:hypothetical protein